MMVDQDPMKAFEQGRQRGIESMFSGAVGAALSAGMSVEKIREAFETAVTLLAPIADMMKGEVGSAIAKATKGTRQ